MTRSLGDVEVVMDGPLGALDGYCCVSVSLGVECRSALTLSLVAVGAILAPIPVLAIAVILGLTLPLAACCH